MRAILLSLLALFALQAVQAQTAPALTPSCPLPTCTPALPSPTPTPTLEEQIKQAQMDCWTLQYQIYQSEHDLDIAKINKKEYDLQNQKNGNPGAMSASAMQAYSNLEIVRSNVETKYTLAQQWYTTIQSGDIPAAKVIQNQIYNLR